MNGHSSNNSSMRPAWLWQISTHNTFAPENAELRARLAETMKRDLTHDGAEILQHD